MMSQAVNPLNGGDSAMPGNYESWPGVASRTAPFVAPSTPFPRIPAAPPMSTPFPRRPMVPPMARSSMRRPPIGPQLRPRRRRRRALTPEIEIERPRHRSSWGRNRVITVPLDHRPTLGLRGPPRCVVEIERVRCHRRRRPRSSCYEDDYYDPPPRPAHPTSMIANPIANPCLPAAQSSLSASAELLSNLTPEMIENLPTQTVHLPPIHLPGSQADASTELQTVVFPTEIINPVDGTLSVIQSSSGMNGNGGMNIQPTGIGHFQPQRINMPTTFGSSIMAGGPPVSPAMATDPLMQRFQELFQRLNIPQGNATSPAQNPSINRSTIPNISQFNPANIGPYPPANIQPANTPNTASYRPAGVAPTSTVNVTPYSSSIFAPSTLASNPTYSPASNVPNGLAGTTSYQPANITPYRSSSFAPSALASNPTYSPASNVPNGLAGTTSYQPANITPYRSSSFAPSALASNPTYSPANNSSYSQARMTSYQPANSTPFRSSSFTPSALTSNPTYRPVSTASSIPSDIGPYRPANITPYTNITNQSAGNPLLGASSSPERTVYTSALPSASSGFSTAFPSLSSGPTNQTNNTMPRSILRNTPSTDIGNNNSFRLNPPNVSSLNDTTRKTTTFA